MTINTQLNELYSQDSKRLAFAKSPMVIAIDTSSSDFPLNAKMCQLIVTVTVDGKDTPFKNEVLRTGETSIFNIASAWEAAYDAHPINVAPNGTVTNDTLVLSGTVKAHVEYILDGELHVNPDQQLMNNIFALRGGVSEAIRFNNDLVVPLDAIDMFASRLSLKPTQGEVVGLSDTIRSYSLTGSTLTSSVQPAKDYRGTNIYVDEEETFRHEFYFINSFGVVESVSALTRASQSYNVTNEEKSIVTTPSFRPTSQIMNVKSGGTPTWKMSSGYINTDWAQWWATEFLLAPAHWLRLPNSKFLPVSVSPSNTDIEVINEASGEMKSVDFVVKSGMNGQVIQF